MNVLISVTGRLYASEFAGGAPEAGRMLID
jgi:hypothetical protein